MQQINFYQQLDRYQEPPFSARQQAYGLAAIAIVMLVLYGTFYIVCEQRAAELQQAEAEQARLQQQLSSLTSKRDQRLQDTRLKQQLQRLERELGFKQKVMKEVAGPGFEAGRGFSEYLEGLARQHIQGLWLTGIHLQNSGRTVSMEGGALKPNLVPQYIRGLSRETVFSGKQFKQFSVEHDAEERQLVQFAISGNGSDQAGGAN